MFDLSPIKVGIGIVLVSVSATVGALTHFAEKDYAMETREQVVMLDLKGELAYYEERAWELEKQCLNLQTDAWVCSQDRHREYTKVLLKIEMLRKELGLDE